MSHSRETLQLLADQLAPRASREGELARERLDEGESERVLIRRSVGLSPCVGLGRHVRLGPDDDAWALRVGSLRPGAQRGAIALRGVTRQPEVESLRLPRLGHEHVGRLDVAVHDALLVRRREAVGCLQEHLDDLRGAAVACPEPGQQRIPMQQLHHDEHIGAVLRPGPLGAADVEDAHHMRVLQLRCHSGLVNQRVRGLLADAGAEQLDGDLASEQRVERPIHDAEPTATDSIEQGVAPDLQRVGVGASRTHGRDGIETAKSRHVDFGVPRSRHAREYPGLGASGQCE